MLGVDATRLVIRTFPGTRFFNQIFSYALEVVALWIRLVLRSLWNHLITKSVENAFPNFFLPSDVAINREAFRSRSRNFCFCVWLVGFSAPVQGYLIFLNIAFWGIPTRLALTWACERFLYRLIFFSHSNPLPFDLVCLLQNDGKYRFLSYAGCIAWDYKIEKRVQGKFVGCTIRWSSCVRRKNQKL